MSEKADCTQAWFKDKTPFIEHEGKILETRLELMQGFITPIPHFFVRNASQSVAVEADDWRLVIEGDGVVQPIALTYGVILALPMHTYFAYLECAGNQRTMFEVVQGKPAKGNQWKTGGVSNGEWTGVALRDVLRLAGLQPDAQDVLLVGLDEKSPEDGFRRSMPLEQALHPDTLLAYALNGEVLPRDHGFPLRAVVPGWVGSSWIKWLGRIVVSKERFWGRNNTTQYVLVGDDYTPEGEARGQVVTVQTIKSALALPWPAYFTPGQQRIHGYAHSPHGKIAKVEWSVDHGQSWQTATILEPQIQYSWARFVFHWEATLGEHTLMVRATDVAGNTQPDEVPYNTEGYLFNQPLPHPITVLTELPTPSPIPTFPPRPEMQEPGPAPVWGWQI